MAAGPAISRTKAAPGLSPFKTRDIAMGMEPVAQTYIGTATTIIASIASNGRSLSDTRNWSGTYTVISAATTNPMTSHLPTLATMSTNPYLTAAHNRAAMPVWLSLPSEWQQSPHTSVQEAEVSFPESATCFCLSLSNALTQTPPTKPPTRAAMGRITAIGNPSSEYVAAMLSTPV